MPEVASVPRDITEEVPVPLDRAVKMIQQHFDGIPYYDVRFDKNTISIAHADDPPDWLFPLIMLGGIGVCLVMCIPFAGIGLRYIHSGDLFRLYIILVTMFIAVVVPPRLNRLYLYLKKRFTTIEPLYTLVFVPINKESTEVTISAIGAIPAPVLADLQSVITDLKDAKNLVQAAQTGWYIAEAKKSNGPFSLDGLQGLAADGQLNENTWVWAPSGNSWQPASSVPELANVMLYKGK